jgi:hypothetical protein
MPAPGLTYYNLFPLLSTFFCYCETALGKTGKTWINGGCVYITEEIRSKLHKEFAKKRNVLFKWCFKNSLKWYLKENERKFKTNPILIKSLGRKDKLKLKRKRRRTQNPKHYYRLRPFL